MTKTSAAWYNFRTAAVFKIAGVLGFVLMVAGSCKGFDPYNY